MDSPDSWLSPEFGDKRLSDRYLRILNCAVGQPDASFPKMVRGTAELEGLYRFFSHPKVAFDKMLRPHVEATIERCSEYSTVVVAHDTTELRFKGVPYEDSSRRGLGHLTGKGQGFYLHSALVISPDTSASPLGVLGAESWARKKEKESADAEKAVHRWARLAQTCSERLPGTRLIHVMDREADIYPVFHSIQARNEGFVIRVRHNRQLATCESSHLHQAVVDVEPISKREFRIASRIAKGSVDRRRAYPTRKGRRAKVSIKATQVVVARPYNALKSLPESLTLNYLHLFEENPPAGEAAVDWKLLTTEPIDTPQQVERVVDIYRRRWVIEEFFKALKTGCAIEARQLESLHALQNATAMMLPIAWHLLAIRTSARQSPHAPATRVFNQVQLQILRKLTDRPPPDNATVADALSALAALGGHIKNNGDPGWMVLGRGYKDLIAAERVWRAATYDQS